MITIGLMKQPFTKRWVSSLNICHPLSPCACHSRRPASTNAYIQRLIAAAAPEAQARSGAPQTLSGEVLTLREIEVLRLLASSPSASEIAAGLFVSTHTIYSHIQSIYAKLGAHSRYQAVAQAKALKLI